MRRRNNITATATDAQIYYESAVAASAQVAISAPLPVDLKRLLLKPMHVLSASPPMDIHDDALLPTPFEVNRLSRAGLFGTVFRIDFKGHRVAAAVCELGDLGHGCAMQKSVAAAAISDS